MAKAPGKHYIDNKKFYTAIIQYKRDVEESVAIDNAVSLVDDTPRLFCHCNVPELLYLARRLS
jgi:hypothetical protein